MEEQQPEGETVPEPQERRPGLRRRTLFTAAGIGGVVGVAAGATGASAVERVSAPEADQDIVPFRGDHQAGIETEAQDRMHTAAFDVTT
ncbi:MAG: deferrochelatase/peroxidase EfeB, partial [Arthrobacter sp.]